jgi:hypothetical protein
MLPFIGRLPVNSQILAIKSLSQKGAENLPAKTVVASPNSSNFALSGAMTQLVRELF